MNPRAHISSGFSALSAFEKAYEEIPRNESFIRRTYAFSDWCELAPRGETADDDLLTCVVVCFLECIPRHPKARDDMPRWFTLEELVACRQTFEYFMEEDEFQALEDYFRRNVSMYARDSLI